MKDFEWNKEKNEWLKKYRDISFEEIALYVETGGLLDSYGHPNKERYPKQSIFVVQTESYVYIVPYVEEEKYYFLKTIIPNREAKKNGREIMDKFDYEEKKILDTFNRGEWVSKGENLDKYKDAAKQTFAKSHRINFRVSEKDFRGIQVKARGEGIPYQTLVSSVIHKYLSGQLKES